MDEGASTMDRRRPDHASSPRRTAALLQAVLFAVTLLAAPLVHPYACTSPCSMPTGAASAGTGGASANGAPPCHAPEDGDAANRPCQCTDDCCSFQAQFVAPIGVSDAAPPSLLHRAAPTPGPDDTHRASEPRLLPFPTGPPPIA